MPTSYTPKLRLAKPADKDKGWGGTLRSGLIDMIEEALAGIVSIEVADSNVTLTALDGMTDQSRPMILKFTGAPGAQRDIILPEQSKVFLAWNDCTAPLRIKTSAVAGQVVVVQPNQRLWLMCDGVHILPADHVIKASDGTPTNPAMGFLEEAGTGVYRKAAGEIGLAAGGVDVLSAAAVGGLRIIPQLIRAGRIGDYFAPHTTLGAGNSSHVARVDGDTTGGWFLLTMSAGFVRTENVNAASGGLGLRYGGSTNDIGTYGPSSSIPIAFPSGFNFGAVAWAQSHPMVASSGIGSYNAGNGGGFSHLAPAGAFVDIFSVPEGQRPGVVLSFESLTGNLLLNHTNSSIRFGLWKLTRL